MVYLLLAIASLTATCTRKRQRAREEQSTQPFVVCTLRNTEQIIARRRKTKVGPADKETACDMQEDTQRPTIDPQSPRGKQAKIKFPKCNSKDRAKAYRTLKKFREKQQDLLGDDSIEDPDPFEPTYVFYCFKGTRED